MGISGVGQYYSYPSKYGYGINQVGQQGQQTPNVAIDNSSAQKIEGGDVNIQALKMAGVVPCETCKSRRYQDGSDDPGVSFKSPGYIDPSVSGAVVMAHEREHVANESSNASKKGKELIGQNIRLFTANCPECGRTYVSGGVTTTITHSGGDNYAKNGQKAMQQIAGQLFNASV